MTEKQKVLQLIQEEIKRYEKRKESFFIKYFTTKGDKRWFSGAKSALENLECLIENKL
jgi:hypothetical protein